MARDVVFTITVEDGNPAEWANSDKPYFVSRCAETGDIATADDKETAADMMLELLRFYIAYEREKKKKS